MGGEGCAGRLLTGPGAQALGGSGVRGPGSSQWSQLHKSQTHGEIRLVLSSRMRLDSTR